MIPRLPGPYTSMCRLVALLCLIGLGRSRVISCHSRDIGCFRSRVISGYSRDIGCLSTSLYVYYLYIMFLGVVWNHSCMISRSPWFYTSMYRSIALLCLIGLGRSRAISCHSRAIGQKSINFLLLARYQCLYISVYEIWNTIWNEEK